MSHAGLKVDPNPTAKLCDYRDLPHSGGGTQHGPATHQRGGYNICDACHAAILEAERQEDELYRSLNAQHAGRNPFHEFLDLHWPLWRQHVGSIKYHDLRAAFRAGQQFSRRT